MLAGKARKSAKKFTVYEAKCILRQIKNNPILSATTLTADIENHLLK
jgi:hypothetical protein